MIGVSTLLENFETITEAPGGVQRVREIILDLAVRGQLVPASNTVETAKELLTRASEQAQALSQKKSRKADNGSQEHGYLMPQVPSHWEVTPAGSLGQLVRGVTYAKADASLEPAQGKIPLLRANNIDGTVNYESLVHIGQEKVKAEQILRRGDILICTSSGSQALVGKAALITVDRPATFGAFCAVFRPLLSETVPYMALYFQSPLYRRAISKVSRGIGINNLRVGDILQLQIPLPPLVDQVRIVAKIDELLSMCEQLDSAIRNRTNIAFKLAAEVAHLVEVG